MSEHSENASKPLAPNWVTPRGARRYTSASPVPTVQKVPALPRDLSKTPSEDGQWHLPERTTFSAEDEVNVHMRATDGGIRPEDLLAQVLGQGQRMTASAVEAVRPEDMIPVRAKAAEESAPAPEDMVSAMTPTEAIIADDAAADDIIDLASLGAIDDDDDIQPDDAIEALRQALPFDDDDDDRLSVSEYLSVLDLESAASQSQDVDTVPLSADDLSPAAQAALRAKVEQASQRMDSVGGESAADIARRMAAQLSNADATLDMPATSEQPSQAATVMLTPEEEKLAEQFRQTAAGVSDLRARYQRGEISYDDVQNRQREFQIYDERTQSWWMMGIDSGKWFRFDSAANQWVEEEPPVPLARPATPTATGQFRAEDIISGSLPYLPQEGVQEYSSQPLVDAHGDSGTPVPRPGQPVYDPDMTMPGNAASLQTLLSSAETMPSMNTVDAQYTMPMNTVPATPAYTQDYNQSPMVSAPDYGYQQAPTFETLRQTEAQSRARVLLLVLFAIAGCGVLSLAAGAAGIIVWYNNTIAPYEAEIAALANYRPTFQTARILDANGDLIVELNSQQGGARRVIPLSQMSPYVLHAVISSENPTFYDDPGFDFFAIVRALLQNIGSQQIVSGASTITQQVARNLILRDSSTTAERKLTEIMVAMAISQQYSKNDILQLYMNEAFFGNQSYGIQAASEFYFDIDASDLNMPQSALLAGIISSPLTFDPVTNFTAANEAMRVVIRRMVEKGCIQFQHGSFINGQPFCISEATFVDFNGERVQLLIDNADGTYGGLLALQLAEVQTRRYLPRASQLVHPHFVLYVQAQVEQAFGPNTMFQRGFTIYTTLNPRIQVAAEQSLASQVAALVNNGVNTGAVMVTDPQTGAIRAMVGSPDFNNERIDGQVDNTRTWQQAGSAIKPMLYAAAFEGGPNGYLTPASILWDVQSSYPIAGQAPYAPVNFAGTFYGPTPLRFALQNSYNVSAVKAYEFIGNEKFVDTATRMGINFLPDTFFGLPSALGANDVRLIDMMKAYGTIANGGRNVPLYTIDRITEDINGTAVEVPLPERAPIQAVISPQVSYLLQNILSDDNARAQQFGQRGPLTLANIGIPTQGYVGAKTGTSNEGRDLWTMGFTSNAVVGVWLGTYDNSPTVGVSGSNAPAQVWNRVMVEAISGRTPAPFNNPGGVVQNTICRDTGTLAGANCANRTSEIYIQTQPPPPDTQGVTQTLNVDSWTGYLANEFCSENVVSRTYANIADPFAINWIQNTQQGRQWAQLVGLPADLQAAPTVACSQGQLLPNIVINNPPNGQQVTGVVNVTGQISAPEFNRYDIEFASAAAPETFTRITSSTQQLPTPGSPLGTWDTTTVPNGTYILRLVAYSNTGGNLTRTVTVNIANIPPTPTPQPIIQFTPTPPFVLPTPLPLFTPQGQPGGFQPLPFDPSNQPTPTATLAP